MRSTSTVSLLGVYFGGPDVPVCSVDLLGQEYPEISVGPIVIESNEEGLLPVFELLVVRREEEPRPHGGRGPQETTRK